METFAGPFFGLCMCEIMIDTRIALNMPIRVSKGCLKGEIIPETKKKNKYVYIFLRAV